MLPSLRLLHGIACPDHQPPHSSCLRQPCLFSHQHPPPIPHSNSRAAAATATPRLANREGQLKSSLLKQRQVIRSPAVKASVPLPVSRASIPASPSPSTSRSLSVSITRSNSKPNPNSSSSALLPPDAPLTPPRIHVNRSSTSHTPIAVRQKLLDNLYAAFLNLYAALPSRVQLGAAHRDALRQEVECLKTTSRLTYRNAIIGIIARLRKRTPAPSGSKGELYFTGTLTEFEARQTALSKLESGAHSAWLEVHRLEHFLLTPQKMLELDYVIEEPEGEIGIGTDASGTEERCERCRLMFMVSNIRLPGDDQECSFHWGKTIFERVDGKQNPSTYLNLFIRKILSTPSPFWSMTLTRCLLILPFSQITIVFLFEKNL